MSFKIEAATPDMAMEAAALLRMTMGAVGDHVLGEDNSHQTLLLLGRLFSAQGNLFSHEFAAVAMAADEIAGLVLGYPARRLWMREFRTACQLSRAAGMAGVFRTAIRSRHFIGSKQTEGDEYFIAHLSVLKAYQGQGIARALLSHAERAARGMGIRKASLTVDVENERAPAVYRRSGYDIVGSVMFAALEREIGFRGFHRMVKRLP
jgi:ribosomal protein S18 acetylase RimI-like enzyme